MKKLKLMLGLCILTACFLTGCVDRADMQGINVQDTKELTEDEQVVKTTASPIEGYRLVAGNLEELDTRYVSMQTADGHALSFKLAPETLVYKARGKEFIPGDEITVVFEGNLKGTDTENVSVIAVSTSK